MFDLEVGSTALKPRKELEAIVDAMNASAASIQAFTVTPWEEHCTECAMPACYKTCDLYESRPDGHCRRFVNGVETIAAPEHPQGFIARVQFKRWAQLMATTQGIALPLGDGVAVERRVERIQSLAAALPLQSVRIAGRKGIPSRLVRRWKMSIAAKPPSGALAHRPTAFHAEIHNPSSHVVNLSLTINNPGRVGVPPFQTLLVVNPGMNTFDVPVEQIAQRIDVSMTMNVMLVPNVVDEKDEGLELFLGLMAFVVAKATETNSVSAPAQSKVRHIKVAVWDLDNTLWKGTLIEDGIDGLQLREEAVRAVKELDKRGIVNSIASKNHEEDALQALRHFGLAEMFVFPKIGWAEKGVAIRQSIKNFNVDANTFAFIDDQIFERDQVKATNPSVRTYDASEVSTLLDLPEFNPPVSGESASRRSFYQSEEGRVRDAGDFNGDYFQFLRTCEMKVSVSHPDASSFARIQELVQRTNQLNYSGSHYSRDETLQMLADPRLETFVVSCTDRYGDYGTVGFAVVEKLEGRLRDAMFSCRIQMKHVEHAFISFLLHRYRADGHKEFRARFVETKKNGPAAGVFSDLGFSESSQSGATRTYSFDLSGKIPDDRVAELYVGGSIWKP